MKPLKLQLILVIVFCSSFTSFAQVSKDAAVQLEVSIGKNPANLTLHWPVDTQVTSGYDIYRRDLGSTSWGASKKHLAAAAVQYSDSTVVVGKIYEYRVRKILKAGTTAITAYGYTQSGIEVPMVADHGKIILLVDKTFSDSLKSELSRLEDDLWREGWHVLRHDVLRTEIDTNIKKLIVSDYNDDPINTKALFIFGHVPVPYSGIINPDGHPDHKGAWPADVYYGEFIGDWTDDLDGPSGVRPANLNIAGDGKFDISALSEISSTVDLMIGRVDLSDMGAFTKSEKELLKQYLDKDHNFRTGVLTAPARGLIDDNFGYFSGEAFASSGWRNIAPMVGIDSMKEIDWFTTLPTEPYLWAYGTGGGYDQGAGGVGTTQDFAAKDSKAIFTLLFGSYFGDWNTTNNFLRAPLCTSYGLCCAWSGRPFWHVFPMGLGEPLGYCAKLTQNNTGDYVASSVGVTNWVHIALMGDPTLVMHPVAASTDFLRIVDDVGNNRIKLDWNPSLDPTILGYYVFRSSSQYGNYYLLTSTPITQLSYIDTRPLLEKSFYFVRAVKLEVTPSGSYFNLSPAMFGWGRVPGFGVLAENNQKESLNITKTSDGVQIILEKTYTSQVKLEVYDASGKIIRQLNNGTLSPGTYRYDWQTSSVASGVYFVRAIGMKEALTAKILVVQ